MPAIGSRAEPSAMGIGVFRLGFVFNGLPLLVTSQAEIALPPQAHPHARAHQNGTQSAHSVHYGDTLFPAIPWLWGSRKAALA